MKEFNAAVKIILGTKADGYYLAGLFFCFLGILLSLYIHSKTRDVSSKNTPAAFSWSFLLCDNIKRIGAGLIVMFIFFRVLDLSNPSIALGLGFTISFGLDKLILWLMDRYDFMKFLNPIRRDLPQPNTKATE